MHNSNTDLDRASARGQLPLDSSYVAYRPRLRTRGSLIGARRRRPATIAASLFMVLAAALSGASAARTGPARSHAIKPPFPPPTLGEVGGPPPVWLDAAGTSLWLAYGSYCWASSGKGACVDFIRPDSRNDIPTLLIRRGSVLAFHFPFLPTRRVSVYLNTSSGSARTMLARARIVRWRPLRSGMVALLAEGRGGKASYLILLTLG